MNVARAAALPLAFVLLFTIETACTLLADEEADESLIYPTLLNVSYDAESPHAGSVVILFEGIGREDALYRIYRSATPLTSAQNLASAELAAEVTSGQLPYRDVPPQEGAYYYAVTAVLGGEEKRILVPYHNTTVSPVDFSPLPQQIESFEIRPEKGTAVSIHFSPFIPETAYKLYVSDSPIESAWSLEPAATTAERSFFELVLKESAPYYFAITAQNRLGAENRDLTPGKNTSAVPYAIEVPAALPPKEVQASEKTPETKTPKPREAKKAPKIPTPSEEVERVLRTCFSNGRYADALEGFRAVLARVDLSAAEASTVHFYIGQCEFYLGEYRNAIRSFILSKDDPERKGPADAWIERCLERID